MPVRTGALFQVLHGGRALGVLLFFEELLAADHDVAALLVELDDPDLDLLAQVAVEIAHRPDLKLRAGQERLDADVDGESALDAAHHGARHGSLFAGGLLDHVPHAQTLRALVVHQVAALGLLALDDHVNQVAGLELDRSGVVGHLLQRHQALGLEAHIHDQILIGLLLHLAGDDFVSVHLDGGRFGGLLALKGGQSRGKILAWLGRSMSFWLRARKLPALLPQWQAPAPLRLEAALQRQEAATQPRARLRFPVLRTVPLQRPQ